MVEGTKRNDMIKTFCLVLCLISVGAVSSVTIPTFRSIERRGQNVVLTWDRGTLEVSETVDGPWVAVPGIRSPMSVLINGPKWFFRLR